MICARREVDKLNMLPYETFSPQDLFQRILQILFQRSRSSQQLCSSVQSVSGLGGGMAKTCTPELQTDC